DELQKALAEMEAVAALAEKEFARRSALVQKNAVSEQSLDQARSNLDAAKARVDQAKANLDEMKLVAPEDGIVIRRDGEVGELIPANQPVFWMSCCSGLRVAAEVDEEDIALVRLGQSVAIRADAFPGKVFPGKVQSITPKGDPVSRSYRVRIGLEADTPLMIGMTAETNIILREEKNALLIPAGALRDGSVFIVKDGKPVPTPVETGAKTAQAVEIRGGIGPDDLVVMDPAAAPLDPGKRIRTRIKPWKAP
ncbi:MAG: efflux RND transporter periplasmic adaptor subunit, partial [Micavibrio aeruginosavorus]|nr:efflux RND transporter periplasmic adaptor subunit [Micavibrio aeruginosavorus]